MKSLNCIIQHALTTELAKHQPDALLVGLSGGVDSVVLLHALVNLRDANLIRLPRLAALHVNHGISEHAQDWQVFCSDLCSMWDVDFYSTQVDVKPVQRQSIESIARDKRYNALQSTAQYLSAAILTGHHCDDQAETVLLQLKRGAGPKGLAAMGASSKLNDVYLWRPLLSASRTQIAEYANTHQLRWVEDESNADTRYDRNFLRQILLPQLGVRWPGFSRAVSRTASMCASQQQLLDEVCDERLASMVGADQGLSLDALDNYSRAWQQVILRRWIEQQRQLMPSAAQLEQIMLMSQAGHDRQPEVIVGGYCVHRYNHKLYLLSQVNGGEVVELNQPINLPLGVPVDVAGKNISVSLRPDRGGEPIFIRETPLLQIGKAVSTLSVKPVDARHHKPLKQWYKQWKTPPWVRKGGLLLTDADQPLAIILPSATSQIILLTPGAQQTQPAFLTIET